MPSQVSSVLSTYDVSTGETSDVARFDRRIEAPNWTKDGTLIYNADGSLYAYDLDRRDGRTIPSGFANRINNDHVLSPDGQWIGISHHSDDGLSRIYVLPRRGGDPRLITPLGPSYLHGWSPDGSTLAYCAERNGQFDIYTVPAAGGNEIRLTATPGLDDGPEYSPDGRSIWFNSVRTGLMQIWRMNPDGSAPTQMTDRRANCWFPHVSPDGAWVVYLAYREGDVAPDAHPPGHHVTLEILPTAGGTPRVLTHLFGGQGSLNVNSWAPDSRRFAFVRYEQSAPG